MAATTEEVPRPYGRGTSSVVSFVVAMNRVDVVDLVVDLVDVDLDVDLVDVDLDVVPFCGRCPAGGLDLEKSIFLGNKRLSFLLMLPCRCQRVALRVNCGELFCNYLVANSCR